MPDEVVLAHPLTEAGRLPLPPLAVAAIAVAIVAGVAAVGAAAHRAQTPDLPDATWYRRPLSRLGVVGRTVTIVLLIAAVVAGRLGVNRPSANIGSVLVMGVGLPGLVLACLLFGRVWERLDPWDGLARLLRGLTTDVRAPAQQPQSVTWAVPFALAFGWYISAYRDALLPRSAAAAVAAYTVITLAGCLAAGRVAWITRAEVVGIFLRAVGRVRGRRLVSWAVPASAWAVLGVVAGGFLFLIVRDSELWTPLSFGVGPAAADLIGFALCAAAGAGVLGIAESRARHVQAVGLPTAGAVPAIAGMALAASLSRGQSLIAVQLLPAVLSDPLGRGWNLFGTAHWMPSTNPLGDTLHIAVQVLLLVVGGVLGARIVRRRAEPPHQRRARILGVGSVATLVVLGVLGVTTA